MHSGGPEGACSSSVLRFIWLQFKFDHSNRVDFKILNPPPNQKLLVDPNYRLCRVYSGDCFRVEHFLLDWIKVTFLVLMEHVFRIICKPQTKMSMSLWRLGRGFHLQANGYTELLSGFGFMWMHQAVSELSYHGPLPGKPGKHHGDLSHADRNHHPEDRDEIWTQCYPYSVCFFHIVELYL